MNSPFPGMDPFLEQFWGDIRSSLIVYMRDQINEQLPDDLQARVEEGLMVDADEYRRTVYPDVHVIETQDTSDAPDVTEVNAVVAEPCVLALPDERRTQRFIEIIDRNSGNRVVTAIELLSPANKRSESGRQAYREKQRECLQARVNLVEIDLIRVPLQDPLPNIRIPLRPTDPDLVLQLQTLLNECYRRGRYGSLDYNRTLNPKLKNSDQIWAEEMLRQQGRIS